MQMTTISVGNDRQPEIKHGAGTLEISGRSFMDNATEFYRNVISRLRGEIKEGEPLVATFKLEYFNTSSSKCLLEILKFLRELNAKGTKVNVLWYYSEKCYEMLEAGEDYMDLTTPLPFEIIEEEEDK